MKTVLIDVDPAVPYFVGGRINGIGRTCRELVMALSEHPEAAGLDIHLYSQNMKGRGARDFGLGMPAHHLYLPHRRGINMLVGALGLRERLCRYDLLHITHNHEFVADPARCIVTLHDAMFFSHPEQHLVDGRERDRIARLARECRAVITCSESSKADIVEYVDIPAAKVTVIPWGVRHDVFHPQPAPRCAVTGGNPYFISTSCSDGRKNTLGLLRAFAVAAASVPHHHLVLVWPDAPSRAVDLARELGVSGRVHFLPTVSDRQLASLYSGAVATVFPSFYEGFGLPVLESMACGTPVVTCRNSALAEVGGDAAVYVNPRDPVNIARGMLEIALDGDRRHALAEASIARAAGFTWSRCAGATIDVYRQCLG